jgi:site-specific recombinase XerD
VTSLGVWLKWMSRRNLLEYNRVAELELPRPSHKLPDVLTCRETEAVLHTRGGVQRPQTQGSGRRQTRRTLFGLD